MGAGEKLVLAHEGVLLVVDVLVGQADLVDGRRTVGESRLRPLGHGIALEMQGASYDHAHDKNQFEPHYLPKSREKKVGVIMLRAPGQNRVVQGLLDGVLRKQTYLVMQERILNEVA